MVERPITYNGYDPDFVDRLKRTCRYMATKLGDYLDDIIVVGGLVPSLIIPQEERAGFEVHCGTMDLDFGLQLSLLNNRRYQGFSNRLREAGFEQDQSVKGNPTRQRWRLRDNQSIIVEFLIPPSEQTNQGGKLQDFEEDFAAFIIPGLELAFRDRIYKQLDGYTIYEEYVEVQIGVCGPGAFIVLKALAFRNRGADKDAYDLFYVLHNFGESVKDIAAHLIPLLDHPQARKALAVLQRDFLRHDGIGPIRAARFRLGVADDAIQADVVGDVEQLLQECGVKNPQEQS